MLPSSSSRSESKPELNRRDGSAGIILTPRSTETASDEIKETEGVPCYYLLLQALQTLVDVVDDRQNYQPDGLVLIQPQ